MFDFQLPDSRTPAQLAATRLLRADELAEALDALRRARFVLAIVVSSDLRRSVEGLRWSSPSECLARAAVEHRSDGAEFIGAVSAEVRSLREVLAQQPVGVLIRTTLPGLCGSQK
jgi:hypothetical protein